MYLGSTIIRFDMKEELDEEDEEDEGEEEGTLEMLGLL